MGWWDDPNAKQDPDDMFAFSFDATVAMELRRVMQNSAGPAASAPVRDVDIDTEIAERFTSMQQAFLKLDNNKDGRITKKELQQKCKEWNIPVSEAERALAEADIDLDGTLSFDEFARRFDSALPSKPHTATGPRPRTTPSKNGARG